MKANLKSTVSPRGVIAVRAEAPGSIAALASAFEEFRVANDSRLAQIEKGGAADILTENKVNEINAAITAMQNEMAEAAVQRASLAQGGGAGGMQNAAQRQHAEAFNQYFRRGTIDGLRDLEVQAALTSSSNTDGGYLIPDQTEQTIDRVLANSSPIRRLARVQTVGAPTYRKMVNIGGANSGWTNDKRAKAETTTPKLELYMFPAHELYANPMADNSTLEDGIIDIGQWLADEVDIEFSRAEGDAWINGDGDGMPRGLIAGYNIVANGAREAGKLGYVPGGVANALSNGDAFIDLYHSLKSGYRPGAVWLMNDLTVAAIRKLKTTAGDYIWQTDFTADTPFTVLSKPVETDDNMPVVGANSYSVAFGNFKSGYLIVDRRGTTVLRNPYKVEGKTSFYTTKRVGGGVQNFEAIKFMKTATA